VQHILSLSTSDPHFLSPGFREEAFNTVLALATGQLSAAETCAPAGLPAAILPLQRALRRVCKHGHVARGSKAAAVQLLQTMDAAVAVCVDRRRPLVCAAMAKATAIKLLNPKFEMGFDQQKNYDPDRERAEFKQYKRMARKEQRGALLLHVDTSACISYLYIDPGIPNPSCLHHWKACRGELWNVLLAFQPARRRGHAIAACL
jgi:hypothetical protein